MQIFESWSSQIKKYWGLIWKLMNHKQKCMLHTIKNKIHIWMCLWKAHKNTVSYMCKRRLQNVYKKIPEDLKSKI